MYQDKKDQIVNALHDAAHEVSRQTPPEHHAMVTAGAVPPWLQTLLQSLLSTLGPAFAAALQQWLSTIVPTPPKPSA